MFDKLDLIDNLEPFVTLSSITPVSRAVSVLGKPNVDFVVVTKEGNPQAVLVQDTLSALAYEQNSILADVLGQLSTSIVRVSDRLIQESDLQQVNSLLERTSAPGLLVFGNKHVRGIVARGSVNLLLSNYRGPISFPAIGADLSYRIYVCRQCRPKTYSSPIEGDAAPYCPRDPIFHGQMELDT